MDHLLGPRHRQALALLSARSRDQIHRYLTLLHSRNYARGTLAVYAGAVIRLLRSLPIERHDQVRRSFARVTANDIDSLIAATRQQGLSPGTIKNTIDLLRGFFRFLCEENEMSAQPVLKHRHSILVPVMLPKPMHETDLAAFFRVIDSIRDRLIFLLMLRCGLRISEVCRLAWPQVDLSQGTLLISDGKGQVDRTAYLSPDLEQALRLWQMRRGDDHYIFTSSQFQSSHIHCRTVCRMMAKYLEQAGISRHYTPHSLRHTFATQMLNAGVTLEVLKELMGHRSLQMTLCYAQLYETTKRQQYDQAMTRIEKRQAGLGR